MTDLSVGVKIYDNDLFLKYGMEAEAAADLLRSIGVTYVIAQSRFLPMQDSAVESAVRADDRARWSKQDDLAFRKALKDRGIAYFGCLNICFDPAYTRQHPDLLPIDQNGGLATQEDWYVGIAPDCKENLAHKIGLLETAVHELRPEGIHLGFVRWPGFWETWLQDTQRASKPDYSYAPDTLRRFRDDTGADIPIDRPREAAERIASHYREAWRDWKCGVTVSAIGRLRNAVHAVRPGTEIAINTLPFFRADFDDAVTEVFGQDVSRLNAVVDVFEVMAYHQILRRDSAWPAKIARDIKKRGKARTICTLQAKAIYLDGMHAGHGRADYIGAVEFSEAVQQLEASPIDGICVFTLSQLIERSGTADGKAMIARLRNFRQRR
ncbi:hypothetical protein MPL1032_110012 [Mesorhizobium plurifarium]|uniref:Glycosyl hydrolase-like 10 domain-containing protein n=1 Tax=Mesorhizobium plurifarium TaxID=69974 RepID=A0A0K2VPV5_MESPL|nr:hypothetical protein MPL1032_110012 [Mesorhizobium plurifarium]